MKRYVIGFLSIVLLVASILGAPSKGPRDRRFTGSGDRPDRAGGSATAPAPVVDSGDGAMWV